MKSSIPKTTEKIILEAEKAVSKENNKKNSNFSIKEILEATKNLYPEIWEDKIND
tara:strand:+ start:108 stop:272 length:165 start_codon:yes stop_codon:yes gene_type:complete